MTSAARTQTALLLASFGAAWVWPVQTFLLAYAVLGPMHYATEVAWLKDRGFFAQGGATAGWAGAAALGALTVLACLVPGLTPLAILLGLAVASGMALARRISHQVLLAGTAAVALGLLAWRLPITWILLGIGVPTLLHVGLFTAVFMVRGAIRTRDASFGIVLPVFAACIATAALSHGTVPIPINPVGPLVDRLLPILSSKAVFRLLGGLYLMHYLNWGSKTKLLGWHKNRLHLGLAAAVWAASVGFYLYDYTLGMRVQVFLSLLHVFLELPLNIVSFREIARECRAGFALSPASFAFAAGEPRSRSGPPVHGIPTRREASE